MNLPDLSGNSTQIMNVVGPFAQKKLVNVLLLENVVIGQSFFKRQHRKSTKISLVNILSLNTFW